MPSSDARHTYVSKPADHRFEFGVHRMRVTACAQFPQAPCGRRGRVAHRLAWCSTRSSPAPQGTGLRRIRIHLAALRRVVGVTALVWIKLLRTARKMRATASIPSVVDGARAAVRLERTQAAENFRNLFEVPVLFYLPASRSP